MYTFKNDGDLKKFIADEVIETKDAADILGCSRQYIDQLVKQEKLVPIKFLNKNKLFLKKDILARVK